MTPYEQSFYFATEQDADPAPIVVALDYPGRCFIDRIAVFLNTPQDSQTITFYNRASVADPVRVTSFNTDTNILTLASFTPLRIGDRLTLVSNTGNPDDNGTSNVQEIIDDTTVRVYPSIDLSTVTTLQLSNTLPARVEIYRVGTAIAADSSTNFFELSNVGPFVNMDPLPTRNIGVNRKIYFVSNLFTGEARITIRSRSAG